MAAYTSELVLVALCVASALSLQCYFCDGETSNLKCMTPVNCSAKETFCMTTVVGIGVRDSLIKKKCTTSCQEVNLNFVVSNKDSCCTTDLCNASGASSVKSTYTILAVALGFLGALLRHIE